MSASDYYQNEKRDYGLIEVVKSRYKYSKTGNGVMICCPFHDDKSPSMLVSSDYAYCFACGKGWTGKKFLAAIGVNADLSIVPKAQDKKEERLAKRPDKKTVRAAARILSGLPDKQEFLLSRGLSREIVARYQLGYFRPPLSSCRMPRYTFPAWDEKGVLATISYRQDPAITYSGSDNEKKKYLNYPGASLVMYNMHMLKHYQWFVYTGGQIDALSLIQYGIPAMGAIGEGTFSSRWANLIGERKVYILLDNDDAGRSGSEKVQSRLLNSVIVEWPKGLPNKYDVNSAITDLFFGFTEIKKLLRSYGADL